MVSCNTDLSEYPNIPEKIFGLPPVIASFFLKKKWALILHPKSPKKTLEIDGTKSPFINVYIYIAYELNMLNKQMPPHFYKNIIKYVSLPVV